MALSYTGRVLLCSLILCIMLVMVSASFSDSILSVPLFELGSLWLHATQTLMANARSLLQMLNLSNPITYILLPITAYVLWKLYQLLFVNLNRVRHLGDIGYIPQGSRNMRDIVNEVRKNRTVGDCPPVYPNGWFNVIETHDLKVEESKTVTMLGLTLAVFRGSNGTAHVIDAYCTHLGANLGVGGQVKGDCIECPFHGWLFRGDTGKCVDIPYCREAKIPAQAAVKSYNVLERNGFVYMWYHAEGNEPNWEPPEIEEITSGQWKYRGRTEHLVNCHIEDIPENGADVAHLPQVHGPIMTSGVDLRYTYSKIWSFAKHNWNGNWTASPNEGEKHIGTLALTHTMSLFGIHVPILDMHVKARQTGPGIVNLTFDSPVGSGIYIHTVTPIEPMTQKIVHQIYFSRLVPAIIPKFFLIAEAWMIERDVMIWNNKQYRGKPVMVKADSDALLLRHRRWYSQFYSEHSPRMTFHKDTLEW